MDYRIGYHLDDQTISMINRRDMDETVQIPELYVHAEWAITESIKFTNPNAVVCNTPSGSQNP